MTGAAYRPIQTNPTGDAFAHYGRIFKTLHLLQFVSDDGYRRMIGTQLNVQEGRRSLARRIAFGQRGQLRQRYREGMENQLGALGLALNAVGGGRLLRAISQRCSSTLVIGGGGASAGSIVV